MDKDKKFKIEIADELRPAEAVIFKAISKLPPATRLYPDVYASLVAQALADAGLIIRTEETP